MVSYEFVPRYRSISNITNAVQAVVTFTEDHDFSNGEIVSFRCSKPYGMFEINEKQSRVLSHTSNTITVDINTNFYSAFIYPATGSNSPAICVPAGSGIIPDLYPATINLEDVFDNVRT